MRKIGTWLEGRLLLGAKLSRSRRSQSCRLRLRLLVRPPMPCLCHGKAPFIRLGSGHSPGHGWRVVCCWGRSSAGAVEFKAVGATAHCALPSAWRGAIRQSISMPLGGNTQRTALGQGEASSSPYGEVPSFATGANCYLNSLVVTRAQCMVVSCHHVCAPAHPRVVSNTALKEVAVWLLGGVAEHHCCTVSLVLSGSTCCVLTCGYCCCWGWDVLALVNMIFS
jgi:hypothetical protein